MDHAYVNRGSLHPSALNHARSYQPFVVKKDTTPLRTERNPSIGSPRPGMAIRRVSIGSGRPSHLPMEMHKPRPVPYFHPMRHGTKLVLTAPRPAPNVPSRLTQMTAPSIALKAGSGGTGIKVDMAQPLGNYRKVIPIQTDKGIMLRNVEDGQRLPNSRLAYPPGVNGRMRQAIEIPSMTRPVLAKNVYGRHLLPTHATREDSIQLFEGDGDVQEFPRRTTVMPIKRRIVEEVDPFGNNVVRNPIRLNMPPGEHTSSIYVRREPPTMRHPDNEDPSSFGPSPAVRNVRLADPPSNQAPESVSEAMNRKELRKEKNRISAFKSRQKQREDLEKSKALVQQMREELNQVKSELRLYKKYKERSEKLFGPISMEELMDEEHFTGVVTKNVTDHIPGIPKFAVAYKKMQDAVSFLSAAYEVNANPKRPEILDIVGRTGLTALQIQEWFSHKRVAMKQLQKGAPPPPPVPEPQPVIAQTVVPPLEAVPKEEMMSPEKSESYEPSTSVERTIKEEEEEYEFEEFEEEGEEEGGEEEEEGGHLQEDDFEVDQGPWEVADIFENGKLEDMKVSLDDYEEEEEKPVGIVKEEHDERYQFLDCDEEMLAGEHDDEAMFDHYDIVPGAEQHLMEANMAEPGLEHGTL